MKGLIFIGGIHGVGKTYLCKEISIKLNLKHYSASELISRVKKELFSRNKYIDNIDKNQNILLESINKYIDVNQWFLLDGHFCLLNKEGKIIKVPEKTFCELSPKGIIVLKDSAERIISRLNKRDNMEYELSLIQSFQEVELDYSREIAHELNVPLFVHNCTNHTRDLYKFIYRLFSTEK